MNNSIVIFAELDNDFQVKKIVLELITKANLLKSKLIDYKVVCVVISGINNYDNIIQQLEKYGTDEIIIVSNENLIEYNNSYYPEIFFKISKKYNAKIILIGATKQGKEIASYTATKFETGLTADCTELGITEEGKLLSTRPTFGGQLTADILCKTYPQMATVQENNFIAQENQKQSNVIFENFDMSNIDNKIEIITKTIKSVSNNDITTAKIIVSGGLGACTNDGFNLIKKFAQLINAPVAGSRAAYEKGYITKSQQIGQTGKTVAPMLYISIGISGANQHLTGIKNSGKIIAINKDDKAPIFQHADIGLIGDLYDILPKLIEQLEDKEVINE